VSSSPLRQSARTLRNLVRSAHKKAFGPAPRAVKDYATHLPVLIGLAQSVRIEKVLELGCGEFSSKAFLNSRIFPSVAELTSLETDGMWLEKVSAELQQDSRFKPRLITRLMAEGIKEVDLEEFDLVFVDDSTSVDERRQTIQRISEKQPVHPFIVIHDFEVGEYRNAAKDFKYRHTFRALTPQTGIVWNRSDRELPALRELDRTIKQFCRLYEPDDLHSWKSAFEKRS
jgi:hypothetical protein